MVREGGPSTSFFPGAQNKEGENKAMALSNIKGPAIFLAQFAGDTAPYNSWDSITKWAAGHGFVGVQVPTWDGRLFDLKKAAASKDYCDEIKGIAKKNGVQITE